MNTADGFGYSPEGGEFRIKDNKAYWEDGDITNPGKGVWFRSMPITNPRERYAEWSDDKRAAVRAEHDANRAVSRQDPELPDSKVCHLDDEQVELISQALLTHAEIQATRGPHNWADISHACGLLLDYLQSGGEAA